jgi:SOS-response transcriptional repressor LexA
MSRSQPEPVLPRGHIGRRIRYYRHQAGLTQTALARRAKVNQGFLSEIERGRRKPSPPSLHALAAALEVPVGLLIGEGLDHDTPQPLETRDLPLLGSIPAGPPTESQEQVEMFPVLRHLWGPDRYCLRLSFDSMEPTLKPGDLVLVHYRPGVKPEHVQGQICACLVDGQPTLKRVLVERQGSSLVVILRGDNPEVTGITIDDTHDFSIQGVVTHLVSRDL